MTDVAVPQVPALVTIPNVELGQVGTWQCSNGEFTWSTDDLYSCVAALACPAVRRPILKFGHTGEHGQGDPAIGYVTNMAVADGGRTLTGDYAGMPGWLGEVLASAYPDRSGEWEMDYRCQMGHTHPCVLHAVALLGVERPAIGSLASLQDVAQVYGVAASVPETGRQAVVVTSSKEPLMPRPQPLQVAASVTSADVTRAFYASPVGNDWDIWIEELQLDPLQVVYVDDDTGEHYRIPVVVGDGAGVDAVSFGDPIRVVNNWTDAPANQPAASTDGNVVRFASREESRPGPRPTPQAPAATASGSQEGAGMDPAKLREALALSADASDIEVQAALASHGVIPKADEPATPAAPAAPAAPAEPQPVAASTSESVVTVDKDTWDRTQREAQAGAAARTDQLKDRRERLVAAAIDDGRIPPARKEHWLKQLEVDAGAETVLASLQKGLIPVTSTGYVGGDPDDELEKEWDSLHSRPATVEG